MAASSSQAHAFDLFGSLSNVVTAPIAIVDETLNGSNSANVVLPLDLSTAIPAVEEVMSVPMPQTSNLLGYPVSVFNYGMRISPTARVLQRNGLIEF